MKEDGDRVAIGALTRHHDVANSEVLQELCPIVSYAAGEIGDPQVRHVGTIGGSVAHADPASDMPTVLVALGAEMQVRGPGGVRNVGAGDFFKGLFEPDLATDEVLTEIRVPKTAGRGWSYLKFHRRAQDWALVGVAALAQNGAGPSVALTNMADRPLRAAGVEEALAGGADPAAASERAAEGTSPPTDAFASAGYRQELVKVLVRRAIEEARATIDVGETPRTADRGRALRARPRSLTLVARVCLDGDACWRSSMKARGCATWACRS